MVKDKLVRIDAELDKEIRKYQEKLEKITGNKVSYREASKKYAENTSRIINLSSVQLKEKKKLFGQL